MDRHWPTPCVPHRPERSPRLPEEEGMTLQREPFTRTRLDEERAEDKSRVFSLRLNVEELRALEEAGRFLGQDQLGTVLKQLVTVGLVVLHNPQTRAVLDILFKNERNNQRRGISIVDPTFSQM